MTTWTYRKIGLLAIFVLLAAVSTLWAWQMRYAVSGNVSDIMAVGVAHQRASKGEIVLVDVRRPSEWRQTGIPASGQPITMHQSGEKFLADLLAATGGRRDKPLALICATGGRTSWLLPRLKKAGFTKVYNVAEGMHGSRYGDGWLKQGLPIKK
jgi:rhodanese-related sulfurtransferase